MIDQLIDSMQMISSSFLYVEKSSEMVKRTLEKMTK